MTEENFNIWFRAYSERYGGTKLMEGREIAKQAFLAGANSALSMSPGSHGALIEQPGTQAVRAGQDNTK